MNYKEFANNTTREPVHVQSASGFFLCFSLRIQNYRKAFKKRGCASLTEWLVFMGSVMKSLVASNMLLSYTTGNEIIGGLKYTLIVYYFTGFIEHILEER